MSVCAVIRRCFAQQAAFPVLLSGSLLNDGTVFVRPEFLRLIGVVVDPITAGVGDSNRAMSYGMPCQDQN